ncbi:MAG TPA: AAA family ATPase [Thermoanaerobaculia bacterium]|nr:AAA family ATPase [Thermoanaerobaculia bacterium]
MILFLNGAFGIGKTTVARALVKRLPRAVLFDPEPAGVVLQRIRRVDDFQDLRLWRRLTILGIRVARLLARNVVVPMAFSNADYLREIRDGVARFDPDVRHVCLVAPYDIVLARLRQRGAGEWEERRARECCDAHVRPEFASQIDASRAVAEIVEEILRLRAEP